jgi:hypothetical protein
MDIKFNVQFLEEASDFLDSLDEKTKEKSSIISKKLKW